MFHLRGQMLRLLSVSALGSFRLAGASWVVLLAARGFSMVEIGVAEGVFHIASLLMEAPSGALADVFGRKRVLMLSQCMFIVSSLLMAFSCGLSGVCLALVFSACGYCFASGAREALAYDSFKACGREEEYLRYSSTEMAVYRIGNAAAVLCAGMTLWLGYRLANLIDALIAGLCLMILAPVREALAEQRTQKEGVLSAALCCFRQSAVFLCREHYARRLMVVNALLGALATLLAFFLQARLQKAAMPQALLGPVLFAIGLGGAVGARLALRFGKWRFSRVAMLCAAGIVLGVILGSTDSAPLMLLGGFVAAMFDDLLQVRADARLNEQFPSQQRATILSISSLVFSIVMIVLSPLAGAFFGSL